MQKVVLGTGNLGKAREIQALLRDLPIELMLQGEFNVPEVQETGGTFIENAIIKARHVAAYTGLPALADDSGLVVDSLQGAPGVYSARYAGPGACDSDLIACLLHNMQNKVGRERDASFHSVVVLMRYAQDPAPICAHGAWYGSILLEPQGDQGFGYDPVFYVPTHDCSAAQLNLDEKNAISHRGRAIIEFKAKWMQQQQALSKSLLHSSS